MAACSVGVLVPDPREGYLVDRPLAGGGRTPVFQCTLDGRGTAVTKRPEIPRCRVGAATVNNACWDKRRRECRSGTPCGNAYNSGKRLTTVDGRKYKRRAVFIGIGIVTTQDYFQLL